MINRPQFHTIPERFVVVQNYEASAEMRKCLLIKSYESLTITEKACIEWLLKGKTVPEIALILNKSRRTVEKQIAAIKAKLDSVTLFQLGCKVSQIYEYKKTG
jgi:DNA-binding CsgD family transcriptional regulator